MKKLGLKTEIKTDNSNVNINVDVHIKILELQIKALEKLILILIEQPRAIDDKKFVRRIKKVVK